MRRLFKFVSPIALLAATPAYAGELAAAVAPAGVGAVKQVEEVVVTSSRLSDTIQTFPGSYSVVGKETIETQLATTRDIAQVLSFNVPGVAQGNGTAANVEQGLRGRPVRIFIDGIPISTPLRDGGRDVRLIAPTALERIEVIRGASALYGQGGAGGIINYITKSGSRDDAWRFRTEVGSSVSTTHRKGSYRPYVFQSAAGALGPFDVNLNGSYERVNGVYDANGQRLPPDPHLFGGVADSDIWNGFAKVGLNFGGDQRIEAMVNYYKQGQDTDYILVPGDIATGMATSTVKRAQDPRALDQFNRNLVSYIAYSNQDLLGSAFHAQLYYVENKAIFAFEPARLGGTQTSIDSEKIGLQTDFRTRLGFLGFDKGLLLWGVDVNRDTTEQPLIPLTEIDGRAFAPPMRQMNYAAFAQLELPVTERFTFRAGVRHDEFRLRTKPFVAGLTGVAVSGGKLDYAATPINIGGTYQLSAKLQVFGGFSQGFSVPDIGSPLRNARFSTIEALKPKAAMVDNYEIGLRGRWAHIRFTAAYFQSRSKLGADFVINPAQPTEALILREKERIEGVELTLDGDFGPDTRWGASFSWSEGKRDANADGKVDTPLTGRRISPEQFNAYLEHDITPDWLVRVQLAYTGARNKFPSAAIGDFYTGKVEPTTRIDAMTKFDLGKADVAVGVSNLLNSDDFPVTSQMLNRNERYSRAEGRTLFVRLGVNY